MPKAKSKQQEFHLNQETPSRQAGGQNHRDENKTAPQLPCPPSKARKPSKQPRHRPYIPLAIDGPNGPKLKQRHYYTLKSTILIFHYAASFLSVHAFRSLLTRRDHGYVETLLGTDPQLGRPITEGDEVPKGCIEAVYLPNVFNRGGSALAFRTGVVRGVDQVEWFCFDQPLEPRILFNIGIDAGNNAGKFFHHVATLDKEAGKPGRPRSRGNDVYRGEYVGWYESLRRAEHRPRMILLGWPGFGNELRIWWEGKQEQARVYAMWKAARGYNSGKKPELAGRRTTRFISDEMADGVEDEMEDETEDETEDEMEDDGPYDRR